MEWAVGVEMNSGVRLPSFLPSLARVECVRSRGRYVGFACAQWWLASLPAAAAACQSAAHRIPTSLAGIPGRAAHQVGCADGQYGPPHRL